jgi:hypothetical protein
MRCLSVCAFKWGSVLIYLLAISADTASTAIAPNLGTKYASTWCFIVLRVDGFLKARYSFFHCSARDAKVSTRWNNVIEAQMLAEREAGNAAR